MSGRWQALVMALAWMAAGLGLIFGLSQLPSRLDTLLFFSTALGNISVGLVHLGLGIIQTLGALVLIGLVVASLILLLGGLVRIARLINPEMPISHPAKKLNKIISPKIANRVSSNSFGIENPVKSWGFQRPGPRE
ncbi:MAG: hypothetical protein RLZZ430_1035 [Cyanobacteriota bacterium]|jgi:hypothetical protein